MHSAFSPGLAATVRSLFSGLPCTPELEAGLWGVGDSSPGCQQRSLVTVVLGAMSGQRSSREGS